MRHCVAAKRVTDPCRSADTQRVGPLRENLRMFDGTYGRSVSTLAEAGKIGSDRRPSSLEERASEGDEVRAGHAEAVEKDDVAGAAGLAMSDSIGPTGERPGKKARGQAEAPVLHGSQKCQQRIVEFAGVLPHRNVARMADHLQARIRNHVEHLPRIRERNEWIAISPQQQHRYGEPAHHWTRVITQQSRECDRHRSRPGAENVARQYPGERHRAARNDEIFDVRSRSNLERDAGRIHQDE